MSYTERAIIRLLQQYKLEHAVVLELIARLERGEHLRPAGRSILR